MQHEDLGIQIELSPEAAESLRQRKPPRQQQEVPEEDHSHHDSDSLQDDDWNQVFELPATSIEKEDGVLKDKRDDSSQDGSDQHENVILDTGGEDDLSYSPPPSLPLVLVDLEKLIGYPPSSKDEAEQLSREIQMALWGQQDTKLNEEGEDLATDFEQRVAELFENGLARHSDTSRQENVNALKHAAIEYPEYLCQASIETPVVWNTARLWKRLIQTHRIDVVNRLLRLLSNCSRSLVWKDAMRRELVHLAESEEQERIRREQERELTLWRTERRKEQLDQLYSVRETFEHRLQVAQVRLDKLRQARDEKVATEIRKRRLMTGETIGLEAFDFESTVFSFPEMMMPGNNMLGFKEEEDLEDEDYNLLSDYESGGAEGEDDDYSEGSVVEDDGIDSAQARPLTSTGEAGDMGASSLPLSGPKGKERRRELARKRRQRLEEAAKEAEHKAKLETAKADEERFRELFTIPELKMAEAVVHSLDGRMKQIDDLLERLQEEEWEDEENGADKKVTNKGKIEPTESFELTLLDQILAMILGSMPPNDDTESKEHVEWLQGEHRSIVCDWKRYFGRLPVSLSISEETAPSNTGSDRATNMTWPAEAAKESQQFGSAEERHESLKSSFGIIDNDGEDWEASDVDEWEPSFKEDEEPTEAPPESKPKPKVGLRPGGRL